MTFSAFPWKEQAFVNTFVNTGVLIYLFRISGLMPRRSKTLQEAKESSQGAAATAFWSATPQLPTATEVFLSHQQIQATSFQASHFCL